MKPASSYADAMAGPDGRKSSSLALFDTMRRRPVETTVSVILIIILGILIVYPLVMLGVAASVPGGQSSMSWEGIRQTLVSPRFHEAWWNTLLSAFLATILAVVTGGVFTFCVERTNLPAKGFFRLMLVLPLFVAPLIGGIAWTGMAAPNIGVLNRILTWVGLDAQFNIYSMTGIILLLGFYKVPYVYLFTSGTLNAIDGSVEEASRICGRGILYTLYKVTLPMVTPSIIAVSLLCVVLTVENFGVLAILALPANIPFVASELYLNVARQPPDYSYATISAIMLIMFTMIGLWLQRRVNKSNDYVTVSGKGHRAKLIKLNAWRWPVTLVIGVYLFVTVLMPMLVLVYASFLPFWSKRAAAFTLANYENIFTRGSITRAVNNSLFLSIVGGLITMILAVSVAYVVLRTKAVGRNIIDIISTLPLAVPSIAFGIAFLWAWIYVPLPIYGTIWILLIAFVAKYLTIGVRNISASMTQVSPELEAAARVSGASPIRAATTVTIPLLRNTIIGSWVLSFSLMIKELNVSILLYSHASVVLPVLIFDAQEEGNFSQVAAMSVALSALIFVAVYVSQRLLKTNHSV
ncbi:iron ABC transporter permease [Agrobacterium sp. T29]|uniref:ABC transporter permease n=1 Tax=Agrobacterium sp. T29 TaxID=2580515 RepID=UPI00143DDE2B|nr:iron ABC transporter permease [Agrobacterium sp. T29]